jgi:GT2 family glycosyltransferase
MSSPTTPSTRLGLVVVGRNEGERLQRCLDALKGLGAPVVYVDSGSVDASVALARSFGVEVVELDRSAPFTAARGRNAGVERLLELHPGLEFVQFLDGDCVLVRDWLSRAMDVLRASPKVAAVCGRRRELHPERSIYNRLCDLEWNTEVGGGADIGGDSLMRVTSFRQVGGFDASLIAGEDPELSMRLRAAGFDIQRIAVDMTWHDAAIERFGQWWGRSVRAGYTSAQWPHLRATDLGRVRRRRSSSALFWALAAPFAASVAAATLVFLGVSWPFALAAALIGLLALYSRPFLRARADRLRRGDAPKLASEYALFCVLGKAPEAQGVLRYALDVLRGKRSRLIEYKHAAPEVRP